MNNSRYNALAEKDIPYMLDTQKVSTFGELKRNHRRLARAASTFYVVYNSFYRLEDYYALASRVYLND